MCFDSTVCVIIRMSFIINQKYYNQKARFIHRCTNFIMFCINLYSKSRKNLIYTMLNAPLICGTDKLTITSHDLGETLQKLNDIAENIEFMMQKASEENLPFLVCIISENEKREIITKACRKLTHTGQYTHFSSNQPLHVKLSTIKTLVRRANFISSDQTTLNKEILYFTKTME